MDVGLSVTNDEERYAAGHGTAVPRGQDLAPGTSGRRFGRMFGSLPACDPGVEAIEALLGLIRTVSGDRSQQNSEIPAGYTYLGQFVDHDITFDPTPISESGNDPLELVNFRTPRYDLDSLYGSGPQVQPYLYDWDFARPGVKLLVGENPRDPRLPDDHDRQPARVDLPRNRRGRALIGDARNDENLIVSQLHLLFIHFHNKVVDCLCRERPHLDDTALFDEARRIVRWHYQWIVVHDLMPQLAGKTTACSVMAPSPLGQVPTITRRFYRWEDEPVIPVEFSAAAFRCGHSMVRPEYAPKLEPPTSRPIFGGDPDGLHFGGFRMLPTRLEIDWERFFELTASQSPDRSMRLDDRISLALFALPPDGKRALPLLNLQRGIALGLPAGRDVARAMDEDPLSREELGLDALRTSSADALFDATPLWYFVLREARKRGSGGRHLGPVGGRIVAEVLVGLLEGDRQSYLSQSPTWSPMDEAQVLGLELTAEDSAAGKVQGIFDMPALVNFARPARTH